MPLLCKEYQLMSRFNRRAESVFDIRCGARTALAPLFLLLIVYGMCLISPAQPNSFWASIGKMFNFPGAGVLAWRAVYGVLFVVGIAIIGELLQFPRRSPEDDLPAAASEKEGKASGKYYERVRTAPRKESITSKRSDL
jgi:hypothetical protein